MAESEEKQENVEHELEEAGLIKPPDGGYGWVVVFASFIANVIVDGVIFTAGDALLSKWQADFGTGDAAAALTISILSGSYLLVGPIASALANNYGCRAVTIAGALIAFFGFVCSTIAPQMPFLYVSFGLVGGIGFGLVYLPAIVVVSQYFAEKRAMATGLAVCGSGIGTSLFATLNPWVMHLVGDNWRLFLIFIACSSLVCIFSGCFFRPLQPSQEQIDKVAKIAAEFNAEESNNGTAADLLDGPRQFNAKRPFLSTIELNAQHSRQKNVWSQHDLVGAIARESVQDLNRPLSRQDIFYTGSTNNLALRNRNTSVSSADRQLRSPSDATPSILQPPTSQSNIYLSRIGLPAAEDYEDGSTGGWKSNLINTVRSLLDPQLLLSPSFMILAISGFLTLSCFYVPYAYLGRHLEKIKDLTATQKTLPISLLGIINIVARVICGWIADRPQVDALLVSNVALIFAGLATMLVPFFSEFWHFIAYCLPFAAGVACFAALRSVICVDMFGLEKLSSAFGILLLFMGFGAIVGSPIAAYIKDLSGNFDISFYVMGSLMTLSGLICLPLRRIREWEDERYAARAKDHELQPLNE